MSERMYKKLGESGLAKFSELQHEYDLTQSAAYNLAVMSGLQADAIENATDLIAAEGVICRGGKNGAPYPHPAIAIRNKAIELQMVLEERLAKYPKPTDDDGDLPT